MRKLVRNELINRQPRPSQDNKFLGVVISDCMGRWALHQEHKPRECSPRQHTVVKGYICRYVL
jgi:hypothetical protein